MEIITLKKKNVTDFAKERNDLLIKSKADWVFFLDSDEKLSRELKAELQNLDTGKYNGFYIFRKNYFLSKYIGTDRILRLGKKNSGKWIRRVHEVWKVEGRVGKLENPIIHNSAESLHEFMNKINIYSGLHAEENLKVGKESNLSKIIFFPVFKFFQSLLMGRGFVFSMLQSFHSFLSWSKEWQLTRRTVQAKSA